MGRPLLRQVFGDSSDDEDYNYGEGNRSEAETYLVTDHRTDLAASGNPRWERVKEISGLWICRDFLSPEQQLSLLSSIRSEGWFAESSLNQAMRFGDFPPWLNELCYSIREAVLIGDNLSEHDIVAADEHGAGCLFPILPPELLGREPLFDQLIVNLYHKGQGICAHVDLMRFDDGIAIISLESPCVMHFSLATSDIQEAEEEYHVHPVPSKVPVYLSPGSLVIMSGEARYGWKHEINRKPGFQVWDGQELEQKRRISLTLRKLARVE
ncbi:alkylated DNA repair protein ALKBH8 homolog [Punica granatum]|uniref:Alkylated DNA repair protein ALKBH8 homolog n=1 Tax=Punica granatum TaxID=22663 RepID=A0A6P8DYI1_PUNGR|nr:alkylated DNA repair protein ALKBH8 homolog [Punica granatum]